MGLISKYQSGFRKGRSTIDQLVRLDSAIRDGFVKGRCSDHIFITPIFLKHMEIFISYERSYFSD